MCKPMEMVALFAFWYEAHECHYVHSCGGDDLEDEIQYTIEVVGLGKPDELRWVTQQFDITFDDPLTAKPTDKGASLHLWAIYSDGERQYIGECDRLTMDIVHGIIAS